MDDSGFPNIFTASTLLITVFVTFIISSLIYILRIRFRKGLHTIPGPLLASISPIDRLLTAASGQQFNYHLKYHARYGRLVRVGPNHVSISDGAEISKIYSITSRFHKSEYYGLYDVKAADGTVVPTVFSVRDEAVHKAMKRPVANAYSTTTMREFEPLVDACIAIFEKKMLDKAGRAFDLGEWLHWFAFDVISSITFSNRLGFMETEKDVDGIIAAIEGRLQYNSTVGEAPWLHGFLLGNPTFQKIAVNFELFRRLNSAVAVVRFATNQLERYIGVKDLSKDDKSDMLARFKKFKDGAMVMSDAELLSHATSNIFAGSDTTATTLRSIVFNLVKNPEYYQRALEEVDGMAQKGALSDPVTFSEGQNMPYIQACIKEALRVHPVVGQLLERLVPEEGAEICGKFLPGGTIVGINPWVSAYDKSVYGADADKFRPERWLNASAEQLKLMERNNLGFGAGARTCLGKNTSLFEISKLVPQLLRKFHIELADPATELKVSAYWFVLQKGLICRLTRREV